MTISHKLKSSVVIAAACMLSACGGGGSSSNTSTAQQNQDTPTIDADAPTYFTDSAPPNSGANFEYAAPELIAAAERLNEIRFQAGLGALRQQTKMDIAAQGHADWLSLNDYIGHYQVAGTPGFTGVSPENRNVSAGYFSFVTELQSSTTLPVSGNMYVDNLMAAPYHRLAILYFRIDEVGLGYSSEYPSNLVVNFGRNPGQGPDGHPKLLHCWPVKLLQAGRGDYAGSEVMIRRAAASLSL